MLLFHLCFVFFGNIWTSYGAHAARRHNPFCVYVFLLHLVSVSFLSRRELLLWPSRPVKCESEFQKSFMSWPNLCFPTFWLTWRLRNMCDRIVKFKFMRNSRRFWQVLSESEFLWSDFAARFNYRNVALKNHRQTAISITFTDKFPHRPRQNFIKYWKKWLKWLLMEWN